MGCTFGQVVLGRVAVLAVLAAVLAPPAVAATQAQKDAAAATRGINQALIAGRLDAGQAGQYRASVTRALATWNRLPGDRAKNLAGALHDAAALADRYDAPRALTLFSTLELNEDQLALHPLPKARTDVRDADGVVYRYFPGHGFEFHPLGNFAALNAAVASKNVAAAGRLATALAARGVPESGGGTGFEYYFDYGGGRAPWTSGFAQAVAAQALARAAALDTTDSATLRAATTVLSFTRNQADTADRSDEPTHSDLDVIDNFVDRELRRRAANSSSKSDCNTDIKG